MEETILLHQILSRNRRALATFYHTYAPKLRRHILSRVSTSEDAEEILQDTLFAFLEALRDFHGQSTMQTFLFAICHHKIVDFYRKKKLKHLVFSQMPQLELLVSPLLEPETALDATLVREKIARVFARMLPVYREILTMKYLENISVDGIADKLSITFKSAESRLFRARKAFVELFLSI